MMHADMLTGPSLTNVSVEMTSKRPSQPQNSPNTARISVENDDTLQITGETKDIQKKEEQPPERKSSLKVDHKDPPVATYTQATESSRSDTTPDFSYPSVRPVISN